MTRQISASVRDMVYRRAAGKCEKCGADLEAAAIKLVEYQASWQNAYRAWKLSTRIQLSNHLMQEEIALFDKYKGRVLEDAARDPHLFTFDKFTGTDGRKVDPTIMGFPRLKRKHAFEVDHIDPWSQSQNSHPDNLRLLCVEPCHQQETKKLVDKLTYARAKERTRQKKLKRAQAKVWRRL